MIISVSTASTTLLPSVSNRFLGCRPRRILYRSLDREEKGFIFLKTRGFFRKRSSFSVICGFLPVDPWAPSVNAQNIASQLFAGSLFPYLGFLYFITKSNTAPKLTLFGFYFLLAFVGATIPAGIYAKVHYGTSLSNVDWLHGSAESLLTLTNLFIVLGLRDALKRLRDSSKKSPDAIADTKDVQSSVRDLK